MNTGEAVDAFLVAQAGDVSRTTRQWYVGRLTAFATHAGAESPITAVTPATLRAYRAALVDRGLSPHSVHGHQRALRRLFSWLYTEGVIGSNPAAAVPLVRLPPQAPKALSDADLDRLLTRLPHEDVRDRAIILLLADTGCRVGGLCSLTISNLDIPGRSAVVIEKGNRGRFVYFTDPTADALALYLAVRPAADSDAVFIAKGGTPLTTGGVRLMLERVGKRAGVKGRANAHSFRHAFARSFLKNGGNLAMLGQLLGHAPGSPVTVKYYAIFDAREAQEAHSRFSPLSLRTERYESAGAYQSLAHSGGGVRQRA